MVRSIYQWNSARTALILLCCLFFTHPFCKASGSQCFTHEGNPVNTDFPCDPTQSESFCCGAGYACLPNRVCASLNGWARGSCTAKLWASTSQCPSFCLDTLNSRNEGIAVIQCDDPNTYCCGYSTSCNCTTGIGTISLSGGFVPFTTLQSAILGASSRSIVTVKATKSTKETEAWTETVTETETVSPSASPSISSLSSTETSSTSTKPSSTNTLSTADSASNGTSKESSQSTEGIKTGVAVGVPLGALIIASIGIFAFWREQRLKKHMEEIRRRWIPVENSY